MEVLSSMIPLSSLDRLGLSCDVKAMHVRERRPWRASIHFQVS